MQQFARNTPNRAQLSSLAEAVAAQAQPKWLLVDQAIVESTRSVRLAQTLGWKSHSAFEGSELNSFGMSGPSLHEVPPLGAADLSEALVQWAAIEPTAAGLSMICSEATPAELKSTLAYLALTKVEGDMRLHCRCADVRVLPNLLPLLIGNQAARVASAVQSWWWLYALGSTSSWPAGVRNLQSGTTDDAEHLQLNSTQFSRMMDASEPDIMFALLVDKTPEVVPEINRGAFRGKLARILATASRYSVAQAPDRLQFIVLSLSCGESFHEHPELRDTWRAVRERGASLAKEMEAWSDELWTSLEDLNKALP